jgi:hypothetical protein
LTRAEIDEFGLQPQRLSVVNSAEIEVLNH